MQFNKQKAFGAVRRKVVTVAAALVVTGLAAPGAAADLRLRCDVAKPKYEYGQSKYYQIEYKAGADTVKVTDELTRHFMGGSVLARVKTDNASRITFKWNLEGLEGTNAAHVQQLRYTGSYLKKTNRLDVQVRLSGYDPYPGLRVKCTQLK